MCRRLVILASCLALSGCAGGGGGTAAEPSTRPDATHTGTVNASPISEPVDIGARALYLECDGSGTPTVVLEAGLTGDHRTWEQIMPPVSSSTRVCAYDRANIGASEPAPPPRTARAMVADLRALLTAAHEEPPYLLVGFSFGGLISQLYAGTHPDEVAGMVLVDSNHPDEVEQFEARLTAAQVEEDHEFINSNEERVEVFASFEQAQAAAPLPDVPVVVVTAGLSDGWPPGWDPEVFDRLRAQQQADLADSVPDGTQVGAANSTHDVPEQQPGVVVAAIDTVLSKIAGG